MPSTPTGMTGTTFTVPSGAVTGLQALSGAVSGLQVSQTNGNPGSVPTIVLRGGTNLDGSGTPLVMVDGQLRDSMADINPEDIESMEVLKDAGATALYGARASNGVILITTKSGKAGRAEVNLKARLGFNYARHTHEFLSAGEYLKWIRRGYANSLPGHAKVEQLVQDQPFLSMLSSTVPLRGGFIFKLRGG